MFRCTSVGYTLVMIETYDKLGLNVNLRVVIKFVLYKFDVWIHEDEGGRSSELDEEKRDKEFKFKSDKIDLPLKAYDLFLKEGKVGFFCTECNGLKISNIQLWADDCQVLSKDY